MLSSRVIILNRTIVLFYFICLCSPGRTFAGLVIPRSAAVKRDLDRGTWHRGLRNTSESPSRSRLNDSVSVAAPDWVFQPKGLAIGASTTDQLNDRLRLKKSGFSTSSSTIPLGGDQYVEETRYHEGDDQRKYPGRFGNTAEYLEREADDPRKPSDQLTLTTTKNYEHISRNENLDLKALIQRNEKGKTVRKKEKREATDLDFRCVSEAEAEQLRDLWRKTQKSTAALEYIEMGWDNARSGTCPANCTMHLNYEVMTRDALSATFRQQTTRVWQTTNTLANVFQLRDEGSNIVKKKVIVNLLKSLVNSDIVISGATVAILKDSPDDVPQHPIILAVFRTSTADQLKVENLTRREGSGDERDHDGWFRDVTAHVPSNIPNKDSTLCNLQSQVPFETMILDQTSLASSRTFGIWGLPVFDCAALRTWTLHYAVPLFGCGPPDELTLRGALKVDLDLAAVDINQCNGNGPFAETHRCPDKSQCVPLSGKGFHRGSYQCQCQPGLFPSNASLFFGSFLETGHVRKTDDHGEYGDLTTAAAAAAAAAGFGCLPCKSDCELCRNTTPCMVEYDILIRGIPMGIESLCITIGIALTVAIIRLRKTKVMKASFWCLLEIITVGSLLLHATVIIQYFEPTELSCLFIPWLREVGFAIVYGALVLKVYRVLAEFQSRKAHRVQVRDKDLFKYLCCIVIVVIGYMAAWTAVTIDQGSGGTKLLQHNYTSQHLKYTMCQSTWWDYVVEVGEFLFMAFSIYICYRARSAPSNYGEVRLITLAIYNETLVSAAFYITRHFLLFAIHPDYLFLMYFIRCQLTVSITMILILGPKIWYSHQPPDESTSRSRAFSSSDAQENLASPAEVVKLNTTLNPNGDVEIGEINLADMNPEDIRAELKRLYTQLQIYKTKTMRQDNPHISKRRGGRKQTHRRFSLQPFHSKHRHHQCSEHGEHGSTGGGVPGGETEISRTPEESTNSAEGVSIYMDESSVAETTARVPTVTFKSGNKAK